MEGEGLKQSKLDACLYYHKDFIVLTYVDDCLFFGPDLEKIDGFIDTLGQKYPLTKEEDDVFAFLGVNIKHNEDNTITLTQTGLIEKILKVVNMEDSNTKATPSSQVPLGTDANGPLPVESWSYPSVIGMLMYLTSNSRPDIQYAVHQCARFTHNPRKTHEDAV